MSSKEAPPTPNYFELHAIGQLECGSFHHADHLYCKYHFTKGADWSCVGNCAEEGLTQVSSASDSSDDNFVWNFPIDITFKSSNPFGWPQIVIAVYGHDAFGRDVIQGYCSAHVPTTPGRHRLTLPCYSPKPMSKVQSFFSWLQGVPTEYIDASRPAKGTGREVTRVVSQGSVTVVLNVVSRYLSANGYVSTATAAAARA